MLKKLLLIAFVFSSVQAYAFWGIGTNLKNAFKQVSKLAKKVLVWDSPRYQACNYEKLDKHQTITLKQQAQRQLVADRDQIVNSSSVLAYTNAFVESASLAYGAATEALALIETRRYELYCTVEAQKAHPEGYERGKQFAKWNRDLCLYYSELWHGINNAQFKLGREIANERKTQNDKQRVVNSSVSKYLKTMQQITNLLEDEVADSIEYKVCQGETNGNYPKPRTCDRMYWEEYYTTPYTEHVWYGETNWELNNKAEDAAEKLFWNDRNYKHQLEVELMAKQRTSEMFFAKAEAYRDQVDNDFNAVSNKIEQKLRDLGCYNSDKGGPNRDLCQKDYGRVKDILVAQKKSLKRIARKLENAGSALESQVSGIVTKKNRAQLYLEQSKNELINFRADYLLCKIADGRN